MNNRIAALSLSLALTVGLCTSAHAAESQTVQATQNAAVTVTMDGVPQTFHNEQGGVVLPMTYSGTTYLPVRAVSSLAGLSVEWDGATQTVKLTTPETRTPSTSPTDGSADGLASQTVPALLNGSITVTLDGAAQTFRDAQGTVVLPLTYGGTTYLPVRAVCGLADIPVDWDQTTSTVKLGTKPVNSTVKPAGALTIDSSNSKLQDGEFQPDGSIKLECDGMLGTGGYIKFINTGYTTLTFTVTTRGVSHAVKVVGVDSVDGDGRLYNRQSGDTTETYTVDISGIKTVTVQVFDGSTCDATVTNIYLS